MRIKKIVYLITLFIILFGFFISNNVIVYALTDLEEEAADVDRDGDIDRDDMSALIESGYPIRPTDGIPNDVSYNLPTGATLYTSVSTNLGGRDEIQGFAITNIGTDEERIWFSTDGRSSDQAGLTWVASYRKGDNGTDRQYYRTFRNSGHGQIFDVGYKNGEYHIYIGSRGTGVEPYNSGYRIARSTGFMQIVESQERIYPESEVLDVQNGGYNLGFEYNVGAVDINNNKIAIMHGSRLYMYNELDTENFDSSFDSVDRSSASGCGSPLQSAAVYGNYLYTVSGYAGEAYVACYDISGESAKMIWGQDISSYISDEEPEGIKIYEYNGKPTIFIATLYANIYALNGGVVTSTGGGGGDGSSSTPGDDTSNATAATKPTSSSQLMLYTSSTGNDNPRSLPNLTETRTEKIQHFAITDIGTTSEVIWYSYQKYSSSNKSRTYITAWQNNNRVYAGYLDYGGEGQGIDIDRMGSYYSIYTGSMATNSNGTGRAKGIFKYDVNIGTQYAGRVDHQNVKEQGTRIGNTVEISVDSSIGYAVVNSGPGTARVYRINNNTQWNQSDTFTESNLVNTFRVSSMSNRQGGDLCGKYYYYLFGGSTTAYIACYDVTTGNKVWDTSINLASRIRQLVPGTTSMEPEGIKVYYYNGSYKIFIGYKVKGYRSAIFYFDC